MDELWSNSTTMRNPERAIFFLETIAEMEGKDWNHKNQEEYQIRLIKRRYYKPTPKNLSESQQKLINDFSIKMSFEQASEIFYAKHYTDPPMRGRTSLDPLEKMGLVILLENKITLTTTGQKFLGGEIELGDVVLAYLLKFQFPNPLMKGHNDYNTRPFINTLRLIKKVSQLCEERKEKAKGISKLEFGIFVLSLKDYEKVDVTAIKLLNFRNKYEKLKTEKEKKKFSEMYILENLSSFNNPLKNITEYSDNMLRVLRLTKYIYLRGNGYYIDLEPRRLNEIHSILDDLDGSASFYSVEGYQSFIGDYEAYNLPFENIETLTKIANEIIEDIEQLSSKLNKTIPKFILPATTKELITLNEKLRIKKTALQNEKLKFDYDNLEKIEEAKNAFKNIRKLELKPSVALEKWSNIALNIIDDAKIIKPNCPLGDDNEPTFTAPAKVPDIECFYNSFNAICEVTMLTSRDQWFNEGQPVMRHLRDFEDSHPENPCYCLFIAPSIHVDTLNTFWFAVRYEYEGKKQRIIPITIDELLKIIDKVKKLKINQNNILSENLKSFYDACLNLTNIANSIEWRNKIKEELSNFTK